MKIETKLLWAVLLTGVIVPLTAPAQSATLLTNIFNPAPTANDWFGSSVAAVGSDRVLIGAPYDGDTGTFGTGAAYLFSTAGTLLATFNNPTPGGSEFFGHSVAAVGNDRVLIGAYGHDAGALEDVGAAYLFATNGTLLITFTNPIPAAGESLGISVAAVGSDRVLIGASGHDTGAPAAGAAQLFALDGTLLTTITNPLPATLDVFGCAVAAVGSDGAVIGAYGHDTGATDTGAAYLFSIPPMLTIGLTTTNTVAVSWPSPSTGWNLQHNTNSVSSLNWSNVTATIQDDGTNKTFNINPPIGNPFYRLNKP